MIDTRMTIEYRQAILVPNHLGFHAYRLQVLSRHVSIECTIMAAEKPPFRLSP